MATNDLADLTIKMALALRDPSYTVWTQAELYDLLTWSAAGLYPRLAVPTTYTVAAVADTEVYDTPDGCREISSIDWIDSDGYMVMRLPNGVWEIQGDSSIDGSTLFINRLYASTDYTFRIHGYGEYDLVTALPNTRFVPLILARARSEAYRRALGDRAKFQQWQALNQTQNVSVNELVQMVNEADAESNRLESRLFTFRKPKPA